MATKKSTKKDTNQKIGEDKKAVWDSFVNSLRDDLPYRLVEFHKAKYKCFYMLQEIIPTFEWDSFVNSLSDDLPSSFRVLNCLPEKERFVEYLNEKYFLPLRNSNDVHAPEPIPFVGNAFQINMSRSTIKRHLLLRDLDEFLIIENTAGKMSRQEVASMVPALLLDIHSDHLILDACASPGNKTLQIIEIMHQQTAHPKGLLIANDVRYKRCTLLVDNTMKLMPTANIIVVNASASLFPAVLSTDGNPLFFDRILCDVKCSNDGTFRNYPNVWQTWDIEKALKLHKIQCSISSRCFELLKVGGLMVYSTCSLNPIEDEAIVAQLLRKFGDAIELVDVSSQLPELIRVAGKSSWIVTDNDLNEISSYENVSDEMKSVFVPSMFPPNENEAQKFHLDRSFRILPHHQNSAGLFVALLRKVAELPDYDPDVLLKNQPLKKKVFSLIFLNKHVEKLQNDLEKNYGVDKTEFPFNNILTGKYEDKRRCIYIVNDQLRDFLKNNIDRYKIVKAGVDILRKINKGLVSNYRLIHDGLNILLPYIRKRKLDVDEDDLELILNGYEDRRNVPLERLNCQEALRQIERGSIVFHHTKKPNFEIYVTGWLGIHTVAAYISREEKIHILSMIGRDASKLKLEVSNVKKEKGLKKWKMMIH